MQTIDKFNFSGKKAIVRVDFNVPLDKVSLEVTDDTRIRGALPTIKKILGEGGSAILMSHLGRPKKGPEDKFSLKHVISVLSGHLDDKEIKFAPDCMKAKDMADSLKPGEVLLLENLRFYGEEDGKPKIADDATEEEIVAAKSAVKANQKNFVETLASYADVYVNDAFGTAHRAHGSTALIADHFDVENKMFGFLINKELEAMDKVLNADDKPFTAIMGGAKVSDKIQVIENLLPKIDNLLLDKPDKSPCAIYILIDIRSLPKLWISPLMVIFS